MPDPKAPPPSDELDSIRRTIQQLRDSRRPPRSAASPATASASSTPPTQSSPIDLENLDDPRKLTTRLLKLLRQTLETQAAVWIWTPGDPPKTQAASSGVGCVVADTLTSELEELIRSRPEPSALSAGALAALYAEPADRPAGALAAVLEDPEGDGIAGGIYLERRERPFGPDEVERFRGVVDQARVLVRHGLRLRRLQGQVTELEVRTERFRQLHQISEALSSAHDLDSVLELALDHVIQVTRGERGFLMLQTALGELKVRVARNMKREALEGEDRGVSQSIIGRVAGSGKPEYVVDALRDERLHSQSSILDLELRTIVCIPMRCRDRVIGVIYVDSRAVCEPYGSGDLEFFSAVAATAAVAIENARLAEEHVQDQQLSAIGQMAATIIHDLKGPMSTIKGYAQMIRRRPDGERVGVRADTIVQEVDRLVGMTREILEFSRGALQLEREPVRLRVFLGEVAEKLGSRDDVKEKGVQIGLEPDCDAIVELDRDRILRVFENLASNAVAAVEPGGSITIRSLPIEGGVEVAFADDGAGMPEEVRRRVFEPFVTHGKKDGTGLGMAIVRRIVLDHGGRIVVESQEGEGTRFRMMLPGRAP